MAFLTFYFDGIQFFYDPMINEECPEVKYRAPIYWTSLKKKRSDTTIKNHRDKLRVANIEKGENIQNVVYDLMEEKINE